MPTIKQLPVATSVAATDLLPISQGGSTRGVTVGGLLSSTQAALSVAQGNLLGRVSMAAGGPEPVSVGSGLAIIAGAVAATGDDHTRLPVSTTLSAADEVVVNTGGAAKRMPATLLRGLFVAGTGVSIDPAGTISASSLAGVSVGTTSGTVAAGDDARIVGALQPATLNSTQITATGATVARTLADKLGDDINVLDFGADASGAAQSATAINAAIAAAFAAGHGNVRIPAGTFLIMPSIAGITLQSGTTMRGAGRGLTVLLVDDTAGGAVPGVATMSGSTSNIHIRDLTLRGKADTNRSTSSQHLLKISDCSNCSIRNVEVLYSRLFGMYIDNCDSVVVQGNRIFRSLLDGIAVWSSPDTSIMDNDINGSGGDAISAHSIDSDPVPLRSGLIISNNNVTESQGIDVLGAKICQITGNVLRRIMSYGIRVESASTQNEGDTPNFAVTISNNVITDVFQRSEPNPPNGAFSYMLLSGGPRQVGSADAVAGWPGSSGIVANPIGTGTGFLYANGGVSNTVMSPGGGWFNVHGNILLRSLPATATWSQWGYETAIWVGQSGDGSGFYTGGIPETALAYDGIHITGPLSHSRIAGNIIQTSGSNSISFTGVATSGFINNFDYDGLVIENNQFADFTVAGINFPTPGPSHQRITMRNNDFNGDPLFTSSARGLNGTWTASAAPAGIAISNLSTAGVIEGNQFRNVALPIWEGIANNLKLNNVAFAHGVAGYSTSNTGIGSIPAAAPGWSLCREDGDPTSSTFGQIVGEFVTSTTYSASGSIAASDTRSILSGVTPLLMTLSNGTSDGQVLVIKNLGPSVATVTGFIDGIASNVVTLLATAPIKDALRLVWSVSSNTWIAE